MPFLLIGELDQELRQIMTMFDLPTLRTVCAPANGAKLKSHDDMTMGQYECVLADPG